MEKTESRAEYIRKRLREFRIRTGNKMSAISSFVHISTEDLWKLEKGTQVADIDTYFRLKHYLDTAEEKEDNERWAFDTRKPSTLRLPLFSDKPAVPNEDITVATGTVTKTNGEPELIIERINAPSLGLLDGMIQVTSLGMEPTYGAGAQIAIKRLKDWKTLNWGQHYLFIDMNFQLVIRRAYQGRSGTYIKLVADNPDQATFPPFERHWNELVAIFQLVARITRC